MVFDNCQIDVFFHMRNHYKRLKNVRSVVDCSPPKVLKRNSHSESSFHNVQMAHQPMHFHGPKKHNCGFGKLTDLITCDCDNSPPKSKKLPSRPKTRRHPEDSPQFMLQIPSRSTGNRSARSYSKYTPTSAGYSHRTDKYRNDGLDHSGSPISSARSHVPTSRKDDANSPRKEQKPSPFIHTGGGASESKPCRSKHIPTKTAGTSLEEQEYLQFLLRITEDIIKNDLYSNKEMKKVFTSHVKANSTRLELDRMLLRIHELMKELNIPLGVDSEENTSASWTDIEATMKGLLTLENMKAIEDADKHEAVSRNNFQAKDKCICFNLKATYPVDKPEENSRKEDVENLNEDVSTPDTKFRTSLDRLSEHTEPPSSRATCKISTSFSNFGDVDVLPGFECLETPKASTGILCEIYHRDEAKPRSFKTICHLAKKKARIRKKRIRKRKKKKRKICKKLHKHALKMMIHKECETDNMEFKINYDGKPIIITLQGRGGGDPISQTESMEKCNKEPNNDYTLIRGPIYLLKKFLEENPHILTRNEENPSITSQTTPSIEKSLDIPKEAMVPEEESKHLVSKEVNTDSKHSQEVVAIEKPRQHSFNYLILGDACGQFGDEEFDKTHLCKKSCPRKLSCAKLRLTSTDKIYSKESKLSNEEYDLTPQKDVGLPKYSDSTPIIPFTIINDFMKSIEIQTDDFPPTTTIVATALISKEDNDRKPKKDSGASSQQPIHIVKANPVRNGGLKEVTPPLKPSNGRKQMEQTAKLSTEEKQKEKITPPAKLSMEREQKKQTHAAGNKEKPPEQTNPKPIIKVEPIKLATPPVTDHIDDNQIEDTTDVKQITEGEPMEQEDLEEEERNEDNPFEKLTKGSSKITPLILNKGESMEQVTPSYEEEQIRKVTLSSKEDVQMDQTVPSTKNYFTFEKGLNEPTNYNILMMAARAEEDNVSRSMEKLSASSQYKDSVNPSTATVERTNQFLEIEEEMQRKMVSPLFSFVTDHDVSKDDNGDKGHYRKVSILKNPIVQPPVPPSEKIYPESDDPKKMGEAIIRTVESLKERQPVRDPYLDKVLQEIESSREQRGPEKYSTDVSEKSDFFGIPGPSALKSSGKPTYYKKDHHVDDTSESAYGELPYGFMLDQKDANIGSVGEQPPTSVSSNASSDPTALTQLDDQLELRGTPSQMWQIGNVTAKLEELRHKNDKEESEISNTLDKLVETLRAQQEKEEDFQVKADEQEERKSTTPTQKNLAICCGLCKKKKPTPITSPAEPQQASHFSEQEYKAKSEAFEIALANIGTQKQRQSMFDDKERFANNIYRKEDEDDASNEYTRPSSIVHSGNRLSLVRIADEKDNVTDEINSESEEISNKISNDERT